MITIRNADMVDEKKDQAIQLQFILVVLTFVKKLAGFQMVSPWIKRIGERRVFLGEMDLVRIQKGFQTLSIERFAKQKRILDRERGGVELERHSD